jgi:SAM-dependent methyltransferase
MIFSDFERFRALLCGSLEVFLYVVEELERRYGDRYRCDALFILDRLDAFARNQGETLGEALLFYRSYLDRVTRERRGYQESGAWPVKTEPDEKAHLEYLYSLSLSTVLNRSRYELFLDYRHAVEKLMKAGASILEIGAGNCLDATFASSRGHVEAYELNPLSRIWHRLLDPGSQIDLRIEECRFECEQAYDWVTMVELLEHLPDPSTYLEKAFRVLRDGGLAYLTFALRMPQADHLWLFQSVHECQDLLRESGFGLLREHCLIDTWMPYDEADLWSLADDPAHAAIYCCVAQKRADRPAEDGLEDFNAELED